MASKGIGVFASNALSFMDHLVPLCQIMEIPIFCTNRWIYELIQLHYPQMPQTPQMPLFFNEAPDYSLDPFLREYDVLFYVDMYRRHNGTFQFVDHLYKGPARSVCGLHGNSDKKRNLYWIEKFADEDISLIYGQHMLDFLDEKGVLERLKKGIITGNYRYEYYLQHQEFFDAQCRHLFFPENGKKTILYAPTWIHPNRKWAWRDDYTSFLAVHSYILDNIPEGFQVLVKLHPLFVYIFPEDAERVIEKYKGRDNISFINDFPLIYPLLKKVDCYLGDYSSIGYDFLLFDRPLFFLNAKERDPSLDKGVYLYNCGRAILPYEFPKLYEIISQTLQEDIYSERRKKTYSYAYGKRKDLRELKREIEEAYR